jgi:hypothetical protein
MDFKGLGQVEKAFVLLLEEACSHHQQVKEEDESIISNK